MWVNNLRRNANKKMLNNSVLNDSISLNSKGYLDFKGKLKDELNKSNIAREDALLIVLDIIYNIAENELTDIETIPYYFKIRIRKVKKFNDEFDKTRIDLKIKEIFNHDYDFEKTIVQDYVSNLESRHHINSNVRKCNSNFINKIEYREFEIKEKPIEKTSYKNEHKTGIKKNKAKINLGHLSKEDLCFILDLNPELTFEKVKVLRTQVINRLSKLEIDNEDLKNASVNDIKGFLELSRENKQKKEIEKKKLDNLISKVRSFNNKSYSYILSSKDEYLEILSEINENFHDLKNKDFDNFKSYQDFVNHIDEYKLIIELLPIKKELIDELNNQIYDVYLNFEQRNMLKSYHKEVNEIYEHISKLPKILKDKFFKENNDLKNIFEFFNDLDDYTTISESDENNKIRIHNEEVLDKKINLNKEFFKDMSDASKKRAIVLDENNIRVVAGAGTGKTFTIQKKVKYLVEKQGVTPEKILCLCYTNKGAIDLENKVNKSLKDTKVEVCTFHEFCRRVDRYCGGNKSTNRYLLDYIIRNYIKDFVDDSKLSKIMEYFSYYIVPPLERGDFSTYDELVELEEAKELSTLKSKYYEAQQTMFSLQGEIVKSLGELIIANYLFMHEIDYVYEKNYGYSFRNILERFLHSGKFMCMNRISENGNESIVNDFIDNELKWERYRPDFYLPEYDIYLEHFGIGHKNNELWLHANYENEMKDKFRCHEMHGTKLIATYYCYLEDGCLIEKLEDLLIENNVTIGQKDKEEVLNLLIDSNRLKDYDEFKKLIKSFINIFEAHNFSKNKFNEFKKQAKSIENGYDRKRQKLFFDIISDIYNIYFEYNNSDTIDHNREVSNALELIESRKYSKSYDYVLIDEYQDINYIRCKLLQELQRTTDCKIFVVGDDWQSIYRFNGSDVELFINFDDYFSNPETIKLEENRRNPQKIIDISSEFITRNKNQEQKDLRYYKKEYNSNPIKIVYYDWYSRDSKDKILKLDAILQDIYKNKSPNTIRILLLGRKNNDINKFIGNALFKMRKHGKNKEILYSRHNDADITFMTIHQAKGLEYDEVIVLNFIDHISGFPNKIVDDPLLSYVKNNEEYPYAEERRLLYVALTRTLNNVYLLSPDTNESIFIEELREDFNIKELGLRVDSSLKNSLWDSCDFFERMEYHPTNIKCPHCDGKITLMVDNKRHTKYFRCSNDLKSKSYHYDGGPYRGTIDDLKYVEKCPRCRGMLVRQGDVLKCCLNYYEGCMETKELKLDLEDREYEE